MADEPVDAIAAAAIEKALTVYDRLQRLDQVSLAQARKAITEHIYGLIAGGETDEHRLVVAGLTALKRREDRSS
jgi:hypothetical protein